MDTSVIDHKKIELNKTHDYLSSHLNLPERFKNTILTDVLFLLEHYYDSIDMLVLFGSCARGTWKWSSDVDILILSKDHLPKQNKIDIRAELCEIVDRVSTDVVFYTYDTFKNSEKKIVAEIKKDGLILWKKE